ncbi:TPA: hypothetical protein ACSTLW_000722 [Serratia fonticola]
MNQSSAIHAAEQLFEEQREALRDPKLSCTDERTIIFFDDNLNHPVFQGDEKQRYAIYCKLCEAEQLSPKVE